MHKRERESASQMLMQSVWKYILRHVSHCLLIILFPKLSAIIHQFVLASNKDVSKCIRDFHSLCTLARIPPVSRLANTKSPRFIVGFIIAVIVLPFVSGEIYIPQRDPIGIQKMSFNILPTCSIYLSTWLNSFRIWGFVSVSVADSNYSLCWMLFTFCRWFYC